MCLTQKNRIKIRQKKNKNARKKDLGASCHP